VNLDHPRNQDLIAYLRRKASPAKPCEGHHGQPCEGYGGWELHTHPDLVDWFEEQTPDGYSVIPLYGVPVLAANGVVAAAALGTRPLMVRIPDLPADLSLKKPVLPLTDQGWCAVDAWLGASAKPRIRELIADALRHAATLT
jgi:hypothetical protein